MTTCTTPTAGWLQQDSILERYQVGWRRLEAWRAQGLVRSVKLHESKQGRRLYCVADLEAALANLAAGRMPRPARKGVAA